MKKYAYLSLALFVSTVLAETKYEDQPFSVTQSTLDLLSPYEKKAKETLPYFESQLSHPKGRIFYVVTRLYHGDKHEQIFVKIEHIEKSKFIGTIASSPIGEIEFSEGDSIQVSRDKVVDWLIVNSDGTEEGNLQGKASDLLQIGRCAFICEMIPQDGKFEKFKVVSVLNPVTKQDVIDIAPARIIQSVEKRLKASHQGSASEDGKSKYAYLIVKFPEWEIEETTKREPIE
jgi:uncharacterized protein YegJ (DUF2314 family)